MLKELFDSLVKIANQANGARVLAGTPEPKHCYRIQLTDGTLSSLLEAEPEPRNYVLHTIDDLVATIKRHLVSKPAAAPGDVLVLCGRGYVRVSLDETKARREWLRIELPASHEFDKLRELEAEREPMGHAELVGCLRIDLAGAVDPADLKKFRTLRFKSSGEGVSDKQTGKDTLGRDVQRELLCDGVPPPDEITLRTCVYRDLADDQHRRAIKVAVDTDLESQTIAIIPVAGELERIQRETDVWIKNRLIELLADEDVDVVCGAPSS